MSNDQTNDKNINPLIKSYEYKYEWIVKYWRPFMAWQYFVICLFDFLIFPLTIMLLNHTDKFIKWTPLTLEGGGLYHLAMGMIVGVTAWSRGQEKMRKMETNYYGNPYENPYFGNEYERNFEMRSNSESPLPKVRRQPI